MPHTWWSHLAESGNILHCPAQLLCAVLCKSPLKQKEFSFPVIFIFLPLGAI